MNEEQERYLNTAVNARLKEQMKKWEQLGGQAIYASFNTVLQNLYALGNVPMTEGQHQDRKQCISIIDGLLK